MVEKLANAGDEIVAASLDISVTFEEFEYQILTWCALLGYEKTQVALPTSSGDFVVSIALHYETLGLNLKGNIVKKQSGTEKLISGCWEWIRLSVSPEVFAKCVKLNYIPFSMKHLTETEKIPKELMTVFDAILAGRFKKLAITHSFACGQAYGATKKISNVKHSNFNPWHPTNFITRLKKRLNHKSQKGHQSCPSQVWDNWSSEIRSLFGYTAKCTLGMDNLLAIEGSEGWLEAQRNMAEGAYRGGKIGGKIGGKAQNVPQHKIGEWYYAHCDNPNCVEKSFDGKGKIGKSKVGARPSRHRYRYGAVKPVCGAYSIKFQ